tara:strand:- start:5472 stop:5639 length:168 start_codon:yes stop_codon:yes gene_type:complete
MTNIITFKGIEITEINGYYVFTLNGMKNTNTNLRFAKIMISRQLLGVARLNQAIN